MPIASYVAIGVTAVAERASAPHPAQVDDIIDDGDLDEALGHAAPAERGNAFLIGFSGTSTHEPGGLPANCFSAYWHQTERHGDPAAK